MRLEAILYHYGHWQLSFGWTSTLIMVTTYYDDGWFQVLLGSQATMTMVAYNYYPNHAQLSFGWPSTIIIVTSNYDKGALQLLS